MLKEPVLYVTSVLRQLGARSDGADLDQPARAMGQDVFYSPTVFNYYPAEYRIPGTTLVAPQFGIHNTNTVLHRMNFVYDMIYNGGYDPDGDVPNAIGTQVDLAPFAAWPAIPAKLVAMINDRLFGGGMPLGMQGGDPQRGDAPARGRSRASARARRYSSRRRRSSSRSIAMTMTLAAATSCAPRAHSRRARSFRRSPRGRRRAPRKRRTIARSSACSSTAATTATTWSCPTTTTASYAAGRGGAHRCGDRPRTNSCPSRRRACRAIRTPPQSVRARAAVRAAQARGRHQRRRADGAAHARRLPGRQAAPAQPLFAQRPAGDVAGRWCPDKPTTERMGRPDRRCHRRRQFRAGHSRHGFAVRRRAVHDRRNVAAGGAVAKRRAGPGRRPLQRRRHVSATTRWRRSLRSTATTSCWQARPM